MLFYTNGRGMRLSTIWITDIVNLVQYFRFTYFISAQFDPDSVGSFLDASTGFENVKYINNLVVLDIYENILNSNRNIKKT